jgi:hypothetical protein
MDKIEEIRKTLSIATNSLEADRTQMEALHGKVWDTDELQKDFTVHSFAAPFVMVTKKSDNKKGMLMFQHWPRLYFGWMEL